MTAAASFAQTLGIDEAHLPFARELVAEAVVGHGVDGGALFDRLAAGQSIGEALALPKAAAELLYARAHQWFSVGRTDRAEPLFRALCVLDGGDANYWIGYGLCLRLRQDWASALRCLATAASLRPDWAVPHFHALELHMRQQDWAAARRDLAAFEARGDAGTPEGMRLEAARFATALALK